MQEPTNLADEPTYRMGALMGRMQSLTEVLERVLAGGDMVEWVIQARRECDAELKLLVSDHET